MSGEECGSHTYFRIFNFCQNWEIWDKRTDYQTRHGHRVGTVLLFSPSGALTTKEIFESIEAEIERLKEVKRLLGGEGTGTKGGRKPKAESRRRRKTYHERRGSSTYCRCSESPLGEAKKGLGSGIGSGNQLELFLSHIHFVDRNAFLSADGGDLFGFRVLHLRSSVKPHWASEQPERNLAQSLHEI